jgi:hypothetical protein
MVYDLLSAPDGDLGRWLDGAREAGLNDPLEGLSGTAATAAGLAATTDANGRFRLSGVGPEQLAEIRVSGPTIATTDLYVLGRDGAEVRAVIHQGLKPRQLVYHARRFDYAVAPARPIRGVVRDQDTGRPIAGLALGAAVYVEDSLIPAPGIKATTDAAGHYRLDGLPKAPAYRIFIEPAPGQPYPKGTLRAAGDGPAFQPVTFDIALKRGIRVRGKVTDKSSGRPVSVAADVYTFVDNPHVREFPGYRESPLARAFGYNDGRFEVVALPGRGLIGVTTGRYKDRYRRAVGASSIKGYDPRSLGFRTYPRTCIPGNYNTLA